MKRLTLISLVIFLLTNMVIAQDIVNETGKDGKFIVRDAEQTEQLRVNDGNVEITGELKIETMTEGNNTDEMVVWDKTDKSLKVVPRVFSKLSPLSEPLETKSWHSFSSDEVDEDGNLISASVQGTAATNWNVFTTDHGTISLGPATTGGYYGHIYTSATRFLFNKPLTFVDAKFGSQNNQNFQIQTGGLNRITVDGTNGNIGIGETSPGARLEIAGSGSPDLLQLIASGSSAQIRFRNSTYPTGNGFYLGLSGPDAFVWNAYASNLNLGTNWSTDLTIENGGNIGIGTTDPWAGLHLYGADWPNSFMFLQANAGNDAGFRLYESTIEKWHIFNDASTARFEIRNNAFHPSFVIEQVSGDVGIGTDTPIQQFQVLDNTSDDVVNFENVSTSSLADLLMLDFSAITNPGSNNDYIRFNDVGGYTGWIDGDGAGGVNYGTTSDARLKMNIVDLPSALDKVSKINVKKYEMKSAPGKEQIGILAQELYEIYPQAVSGTPENDVNEKPMGIDYGKLTPLLVKAIQELQAEIEILKSR